MTSKDLREWRKRMQFNKSQAAEALGVTLTQYGKMENGRLQNPISRRTALACSALLFGLPAYGDKLSP